MKDKKPFKTYRNLSSEDRLPFTGHLEELRWRIVVVLGSIFVLFCVFYAFSEKIILELQSPIQQNLIFIAPTEAFFANLKVSSLMAIAVCTPVILHQAWGFMAPGLLEDEKKYGLPVVLGGTFCFIIGVSFAYYLVLPFGIKFLLSYATDEIKPMISVANYISFILKMMFAFGIVFEYPLIILILSKIGLVTSVFLSKQRKYAVLIIAVLSALLTPPDVVSQILMILPLLVLYEISIFIARYFGKKKPENDKSD